MSDKNQRVLIVDDSAEDLRMLLENLKDDFAVLAATDGSKALELAANDPRPDVILLDVEMPSMNGYETCQKLKASDETKNIDVIFVSAHDTTEERLAGYDAGGSDYVIKPFSPVELHKKIQLAIKNREIQNRLEGEKSVAMQTAMTAMSSGGEMGVVIEFLKQSFTTNSVEDLGQLMLDALTKYGLESTVQLRSATRLANLSSKGVAPPLEEELLSRLHDQGRIMEMGKRLILNFGNISLLVKNMPIDDPDKCGRLRDHLAILMEGADSKLTAIELVYANENRKKGLLTLVNDSKQTLQDIEQQQKQHKESNVQIMDELMREVEETLLSCGLTEEQEDILLKLVQAGVNKSLDNFEAGLKLDEQMQDIIQNLAVFAEK